VQNTSVSFTNTWQPTRDNVCRL